MTAPDHLRPGGGGTGHAGLLARSWAAQRARVRRRAGLGPGPAGRDSRGTDDGFSLVELIVSIAIMVVLTTMTLVIITNFVNVSTSTIRSGQAADQGQAAVASFDRYLRGAINPSSAQGAAGILGSSACWGSTSPAPAVAGGVTPAYSVTSTESSALSLVAAHDFDLWFCGYLSTGVTAAPKVYEMLIVSTWDGHSSVRTYNPVGTAKPCRQVTGVASGADGGFCTLELLDWSAVVTQTKGGTRTKVTNPCNPGTGAGCLTKPLVVDSVPNVWCDAYCQGKNAITEYAGVTNSSLYPSKASVACVDQKTQTCSAATRPLLTYFSAGGGQFATTTSSLTPHNCTTAGCASGTMLDLSGAAHATGSPSTIATVTAVRDLLSLSLAQVQVTVMPASAPVKAPAAGGLPGVELTDQIHLQNQGRTGGPACAYDGSVESLSPTAYWPLDDTGGSTATPQVTDVSTAKNSGSFIGAMGSTEEGSTPGPLPCAASSPGMKFTGSATGSIKTTTQLASGPENFSIVAWFKTTTAKGGIIGYGNAQTGLAGSYTRLLYVGATNRGSGPCGVAGDLCWGVYKGGTHIVSSSYKVDDGKWHMAVATVCGSGGPSVCPTGKVGQYLWVDGNLAGYNTSITTATSSYAGYWRVGMLPRSNGWTGGTGTVDAFNGSLGRVAVIPSALTQSQIFQLYQDSGAPGLSTATAAKVTQPASALVSCRTSLGTSYQPVAYYPLNDSATTSAAADIGPLGTPPGSSPAFTKNTAFAGQAHTVVKWGASSSTPPPLCDPAAGVAQFGTNTSASHITVPGLGPSFAPSRLTVEAWVYMKGWNGGNPRVVSNSHTDTNSKGFQLEVANGGGSGFFDVGNGGSQGMAGWSAPAMTTGRWYFYAGTYDGRTVRAFINGVQVGDTPFTGSVAPNTCGCDVSIGWNPTEHGDYVDGYISNVAVYTTALSSSQIAQQWQQSQSLVVKT